MWTGGCSNLVFGCGRRAPCSNPSLKNEWSHSGASGKPPPTTGNWRHACPPVQCTALHRTCPARPAPPQPPTRPAPPVGHSIPSHPLPAQPSLGPRRCPSQPQPPPLPASLAPAQPSLTNVLEGCVVYERALGLSHRVPDDAEHLGGSRLCVGWKNTRGMGQQRVRVRERRTSTVC